jgi:HSP20 family protein
MRPELIAVMRDQVRTIHRAVTGADAVLAEPSNGEWDAPVEEVTRRFAELETLVRGDPFASELVPPFSFTPPLDVFSNGEHIVVELAVPGVERADLIVEMMDEWVVVSGLRRTPSSPCLFSHAEIPRGPFFRAFRVPVAVQPDPDFDLERGLLRIRLKRTKSREEGEQKHATATT